MESKYKYIRFLGQGGFGKVHLCLDNSARFVCIKEIQLNEVVYKSVCIVISSKIRHSILTFEQIKREVYILSQLNHPRIIRFIEYFLSDDTDKLKIVLEFAPGGSLREFINQQHSRIKTEILLNLFMDIVMGLEYLHIRYVIHGDLKPENLLLSENRRIKICDFGISTVYDGSQFDSQGAAGTVLYIAPEVAFGGAPTFKSDIWALGCILYELCALKRTFRHAQSFAHLKEIFRKFEKVSWDCDDLMYGAEIKNLCRIMLTFDPYKRISLPELIRTDIIWPKYYPLYFDYSKDSL